MGLCFMARDYHEYIASPEWKAIADEVKARAKHRCSVCNSKDRLEAHHRSYLHLFNEAEHMEDLVCLCRVCHGLFHEEKKALKHRVIVKPVVIVKRAKVSKKQRREKARREFQVADIHRKTRIPRDLLEGMTDAEMAEIDSIWHRQTKAERLLRKRQNEEANNPVLKVYFHQIACEVPDHDPVILDKTLIDRLRTNGAFTSSTLKALGLPLKPQKGWTHRLRGLSMPRMDYAKALASRGVYAGQRYELIH